jgi:hypothetical protein
MSGMWGSASPAKPASSVTAEPAAAAADLSQYDLDRLLAPQPAVPDAVPAIEPLKITPAAEARHIAPPAPTIMASTVAKPALTIEGPTGSFSILPGRVQPQAPQATKALVPPQPEVNPDPLVAGLRAFAANLMAEYGRKPSAPEDKLLAGAAAAMPPAAPTATAAATAVPSRHTEFALPLTVAPPLGDPPQRPAPEPAPPSRKSDISEALFADVMALTDEERIALFT